MQSQTIEQHKQINKQFTKYVVPAVLAMVVQALYTVLDGIIVGQGIGEIALGAVNIVFPYIMIITALAMLVAVGGANVYSFHKGEGETEKANNIFCQCLAISAIIGVILAIVGVVFQENIALLLGANQDLLSSAVAYLKWTATFVLLQIIVFGLTVFVRNDDAPKLVMMASIVGAVLNIILDVFFILILHYGIEAAAITNGVGMLASLILLIPHFAHKKGMLRIRWPKFDFIDIKRVFSNGFATFLMELSIPAITFSFNIAIIHTVGTLGISAYSIVNYVCAFIGMLLIGVTQGAQPLMSFYHGKSEQKVFSHIYRLGVRTNIIASIVLVGACIIFGDGIVSLFHTGNPELTALTPHMFRLYSLAYIAIGATLMNILYFQTAEQNVFSAVISFLRCIGFIQLFLLLSVYLFETKGLYLAFLAGELCHLAISQILVMRAAKKRNYTQAINHGANLRICFRRSSQVPNPAV
jgi:Na+-driven multidrug efflux pump